MDSADAARTPSGLNAKASDGGTNFSGDAQPSRGAGDWVEALTCLSVPRGSAPEKQLTPSGPAIAAKAPGGDKQDRASAQNGRATDESRRLRDQAPGAPAPTIKGLFETAMSVAPKETQTKRAAEAKGDLSTQAAPEGSPLVAANPDGDLSAVAPALPWACAPGASTGVSAEAGDGGGQDGSAGGEVAWVRRGDAPVARGARADDEMPQGDATPTGAPTKIVVTSQATWLAPVRAEFALKGVAATSDGAARDRAGAPEASRQVEAAATAQTEAPALADEALASQGQHASGSVGVGAARTTPPAAAASSAASTPEVSAPRRDLEVVLAPHDLGGLALRLKSVGDRLEIAFVADKGDTARMIDDRSATLESQLRDAGLGLGGVAISVATKPESSAVSAAVSSHGSFGDGAAGASQEGRQQRDATPQGHTLNDQDRQDFKDESRDNASEASGRRGDRGLYL
jgi:hypothetical protein